MRVLTGSREIAEPEPGLSGAESRGPGTAAVGWVAPALGVLSVGGAAQGSHLATAGADWSFHTRSFPDAHFRAAEERKESA